MRTVRLWFLLPLFVLVCGSAAFEKQVEDKKKPEDKPPAKPEDKPAKVEKSQEKPALKVEKGEEKAGSREALFEAVLEDRSVVRLVLLQKQIEVVTPYGTLKVPASQVRRIEFTPRPVADAPRRIAAAVAKLKSDEFNDREAGTKELIALAPASYWGALEAARSEDLEVKKRGRQVLARLEAKFPAEELRRKPHDLVHTPTFTIAGHIQGVGLKVKNSYFGEAQLKLGDLRSVRSLGHGAEVTLALDSSRYALPAASTPAWLETRVVVRATTRLTINATGEIDMYPGGSYKATPAGPRWGGTYPNNMKPGMIVGRIGSTGKEFAIGEKYEGSPEEAGTLYLRIVGSPWNNASTGEYKVSIKAD